jgi:hypothetical protein
MALTVDDALNPGWRTTRLHGGGPWHKLAIQAQDGDGVEAALFLPSPPILYVSAPGADPPPIPFHLQFHSPQSLPLSTFSDPWESRLRRPPAGWSPSLVARKACWNRSPWSPVRGWLRARYPSSPDQGGMTGEKMRPQRHRQRTARQTGPETPRNDSRGERPTAPCRIDRSGPWCCRAVV